MDRLRALHDAGVSIWLDTLSRYLLESGEFTRLIAECSVTGATSNPTIFEAAITGSASYDDQLRNLLEKAQVLVRPVRHGLHEAQASELGLVEHRGAVVRSRFRLRLLSGL